MCVATVLPRVDAPCSSSLSTRDWDGAGQCDKLTKMLVASSKPSSEQDLLVSTVIDNLNNLSKASTLCWREGGTEGGCIEEGWVRLADTRASSLRSLSVRRAERLMTGWDNFSSSSPRGESSRGRHASSSSEVLVPELEWERAKPLPFLQTLAESNLTRRSQKSVASLDLDLLEDAVLSLEEPAAAASLDEDAEGSLTESGRFR